jgi:hypothetical protein
VCAVSGHPYASPPGTLADLKRSRSQNRQAVNTSFIARKYVKYGAGTYLNIIVRYDLIPIFLLATVPVPIFEVPRFSNVPKRSNITGKILLAVPLSKKQKSGTLFQPLGVLSPNFSEFVRKKGSSSLKDS